MCMCCGKPDSGLVVRVPALILGGRRFDPRPGHTKDPMPPCLALSIKGWIGGKSLRHTSVMSRGCTCTSSCLTLQKQEIGNWPMGLMVRQGYLLSEMIGS